ncbi:hypothetical protein [Pseudomonas sp. P8_250]|uniref:hypothetical protein n=1 Tax=Pseudomonas sp. P8_250 TaxID=3043446 RepID=UPI002A362CC5|nr:hypothetical protein [Pseudomonas sp. P8_250]MDX9668735.1 hypothetical protein [Pseudomonas sp. P8_250]
MTKVSGTDKETYYTVVLQVQNESGEHVEHSVRVPARDKDNARTAATEKATKEGYTVTNCYRIELS